MAAYLFIGFLMAFWGKSKASRHMWIAIGTARPLGMGFVANVCLI